MLSSDILVSLAKVGNYFADKMKERLNAGNYPKGDSSRIPPTTSIQDATFVQSPTLTGNVASIYIIIDMRKAPYARAFEFGSGEHSSEGRYKIEPRNSNMLVFPEADWPNFVPGLTRVAPSKGFFFLTDVLHPGIEAKPYIEPTIKETQPQVKEMLGKDFKAFLLSGRKAIEVIK